MKVVIGEDEPGPAVQAYLDGLSRSELHELVLTLAECSETVRRTLETVTERREIGRASCRERV